MGPFPHFADIQDGGTSTLRVLLVEDNPADARLVAELLREPGGFELARAGRLSEALSRLAAASYDAILLDLLLPDGEGIEVVRQVAERAPEAAIVVLSGLGEDDLALARRAVHVGAQDYVPKSRLDPQLLHRTLSTAIERARLRRALARRERQLEEAQRLARMGDWWWRPGERMLALSPQIYELFGLPRLLPPTPRHLLRRLPAEARRRLLAAVRDLLAGQSRLEVEIALEEAAGRRREFLIELRRRPERDGRLCLFGICRDVSEERLVERMKNEFVSVVSHELRTPLTAVLAALGLLAGRFGHELQPAARQLLETAHRNSERLKLIVDDLLDLQRIESGRLSIAPRPVDLRELIEEVVTQQQPAATAGGVAIAGRSPPRPVVARVDPVRAVQALANLVSNAIKFSPRGSEVEIRLETPEPGHARISVLDRGPGVPESFRPRLFTKFAQADGSNRRGRQGTGLGLAIVKAIAERSGGGCGYFPREGGGSVFFLEFPAMDAGGAG